MVFSFYVTNALKYKMYTKKYETDNVLDTPVVQS